jgi:acetyl-CoA carboxylase biotin carboxyl carrier protein
MTLDEIRELIGLVTETGVSELEVQRGENRVRIRRAFPSAQEVVISPPPVVHAVAASAAAPAAAVSAPMPAAAAAERATEPAKTAGPDPSLVLVKSPIVGTFYESSAPGAPPFVRVGERVQPGKVLCIIESMKLMNEIESEVSGVVESKLVPNGQPVEYGEALFAIRAV